MNIVQRLSALALRQLVGGAAQALNIPLGGEVVTEVFNSLAQRFTDHSRKLTAALATANRRSWTALELALVGESWWQRARTLLSRAEEKTLAQQVQLFLATAVLPQQEGKVDFRVRCLEELRSAHKAKLLTGAPDLLPALREAASFVRFGPQRHLLEAEVRGLDTIASELDAAGHRALAWLVRQRPQEGAPLLGTLVAYFFRREIEVDDELFRGLAWERLQEVGQLQEAGLAALAEALSNHGERIETLFTELQTVATEARDGVLRVEAVLHEQSARLGQLDGVDEKLSRLEFVVSHLPDQLQQFGREIQGVLEARELNRREVRPHDSLSLHSDEEHRLVRALVHRYRGLPAEQRRQLPGLLNAVGKLEVLAGEFEAAQHDFQAVTGLVADAGARAEAHFNAYQAALERRDWDGALGQLLAAIRLDGARFAPFPVEKYAPKQILGAGGFGIAFLCQHLYMDAPVVVKALRLGDQDRRADRVFAEAQALRRLDHPGIIRLHDCGYTDATARSRPYVVMDYFEATTLEAFVASHGALTAVEFLPIGIQAARALQAAHGQHLLHRDVKPANLLVRQSGSTWEVKLIDFGLALQQGPAPTAAPAAASTGRGSSTNRIGTPEYAAPEQMGKRAGATVGPPADVYGFGKTACYALFGTPSPTFQHWRQVPEPLAELLGRCIMEAPEARPANIGLVVDTLVGLSRLAPPAVPALPKVTPHREPPRTPITADRRPPNRTPVVPESRPRPQPVSPAPLPVLELAEGRAATEKPLPEDRIARARRLVRKPALALLGASVVGMLFNLGLVVAALAQAANPPKAVQQQPIYPQMYNMAAQRGMPQYYGATPPRPVVHTPDKDENFEALGVLVILGCAGASALGIVAGIHMLTLKRYWLCLAGSLAVMPGACICCLTGFPVGLWSLAALGGADVRSAFS